MSSTSICQSASIVARRLIHILFQYLDTKLNNVLFHDHPQRLIVWCKSTISTLGLLYLKSCILSAVQSLDQSLTIIIVSYQCSTSSSSTFVILFSSLYARIKIHGLVSSFIGNLLCLIRSEIALWEISLVNWKCVFVLELINWKYQKTQQIIDVYMIISAHLATHVIWASLFWYHGNAISVRTHATHIVNIIKCSQLIFCLLNESYQINKNKTAHTIITSCTTESVMFNKVILW